MSGTATRRKPKARGQVSILLETLVRGTSPHKVDADAGIIYGVRVLGGQSENGRQYTEQAMRNAIPLYEGLAVNVDHPIGPDGKPQPTQMRSSYDRFGKLQNVRFENGGLTADLHFLKTHPMAGRICEAAERMPDLFGLSHNAQGSGEQRDGKFIVEEIVDVRHVDVVADAATTQSLFEGKDQMKKTWKQFFEAFAADPKRGPLVKALLEDDLGMSPTMDEPMPDVTPDDTGAGDWKADLVAAIGKLVASADEADHKMAQKIMAMLKPQSAAPAAPVAEGDGEGDSQDEKDKKDKAMESLQAKAAAGAKELTEARHEIERLKRDSTIFTECAEARFTPDDVQREALAGMADASKRKRLIESFKGAQRATMPRSIGHGTLNGTSSGGAPVPVTNGESLAKALRR